MKKLENELTRTLDELDWDRSCIHSFVWINRHSRCYVCDGPNFISEINMNLVQTTERNSKDLQNCWKILPLAEAERSTREVSIVNSRLPSTHADRLDGKRSSAFNTVTEAQVIHKGW